MEYQLLNMMKETDFSDRTSIQKGIESARKIQRSINFGNNGNNGMMLDYLQVVTKFIKDCYEAITDLDRLRVDKLNPALMNNEFKKSITSDRILSILSILDNDLGN